MDCTLCVARSLITNAKDDGDDNDDSSDYSEEDGDEDMLIITPVGVKENPTSTQQLESEAFIDVATHPATLNETTSSSGEALQSRALHQHLPDSDSRPAPSTPPNENDANLTRPHSTFSRAHVLLPLSVGESSTNSFVDDPMVNNARAGSSAEETIAGK